MESGETGMLQQVLSIAVYHERGASNVQYIARQVIACKRRLTRPFDRPKSQKHVKISTTKPHPSPDYHPLYLTCSCHVHNILVVGSECPYMLMLFVLKPQALIAEAQRLGEERGVVQPAKKPRKGKAAAAVAAAEAIMAAQESAAAAAALGSSSRETPLSTAEPGEFPEAAPAATSKPSVKPKRKRKKAAEEEQAGDEQPDSGSDDQGMRRHREHRGGGGDSAVDRRPTTGAGLDLKSDRNPGSRGATDPSRPQSGFGFGSCSIPAEDEEYVEYEAGDDEFLLRDVVFHALDSHEEGILWDVQPCWVILYDLDLAFVRQVRWRVINYYDYETCQERSFIQVSE